jgi:phasin family protein
MADVTNPFGFDFEKMMRDFKMPGVDYQAMMESQRRNIEVLTALNQQAVAGIQAVAQRQAEILQTLMGEATATAQQLAGASPEERAGKQAELTRVAFERAVVNMRELSEMVSKSQNEALETINARVSESLKEVQALIDKTAK